MIQLCLKKKSILHINPIFQSHIFMSDIRSVKYSDEKEKVNYIFYIN